MKKLTLFTILAMITLLLLVGCANTENAPDGIPLKITPAYAITYNDLSGSICYIYADKIQIDGGALILSAYYTQNIISRNLMPKVYKQLIISSGRWIAEENRKEFTNRSRESSSTLVVR
jgi:uncharacterized lipoprotein NlpE involved in copper resistance